MIHLHRVVSCAGGARAAFTCLAVSAAVAAPPKVIKATPDNGEQNVDPALKQLRHRVRPADGS
jgi:hypothetical protein